MDIPRAAPRSIRRRLYVGGGALVLVAAVVAAVRMEPAAPSIDRGTIWTDTVRRGDMVRQVRGPGTLVPERIRIVTAVTAGRVEAIHFLPGDSVGPGSVLVELSNPDVQLEGLDAERQLSAAEAEEVNLRASLETQRLVQEVVVSTVEAEHREALRQVETNRELARRDLIPRLDVERAERHAEELGRRLELERRRLEIATETVNGQLAVQRNQVERLRAISRFQQGRAESMQVKAGVVGVLQELPLQVGQWAVPGQELARVVEPGRLRAVLRIPETQARDVVIGQRASIDTRNGVVDGRVVRIDPAVQGGTVTVDVALEGDLPRGARPDLSVDGVIEIERLDNVLHVGRPATGQSGTQTTLFRVEPGGRYAVRVPVRLGQGSVNTIEILEGLSPGDEVILSDMSSWDAYDRVRLN
jgi:HlyD family secretion protein